MAKISPIVCSNSKDHLLLPKKQAII